MRASSLDSTAYLSPATAVLAAAAAAAAEANGSHEDHRSLEDPVDHSDAHTSFLTYDQGEKNTLCSPVDHGQSTYLRLMHKY